MKTKRSCAQAEPLSSLPSQPHPPTPGNLPKGSSASASSDTGTNPASLGQAVVLEHSSFMVYVARKKGRGEDVPSGLCLTLKIEIASRRKHTVWSKSEGHFSDKVTLGAPPDSGSEQHLRSRATLHRQVTAVLHNCLATESVCHTVDGESLWSGHQKVQMWGGPKESGGPGRPVG